MFHSIINRSSTIVVDELKIRLVTCKDAENIAIYYQKTDLISNLGNQLVKKTSLLWQDGRSD
ncbi:hypothetical protein PDPE_1-03278 [Photobacterium damselae subsp. piscicida]|nr:hypothetical protein PDPE_1-03278 [Photobacterium damselae subsp. piscicida]